MNTVSSMTPSSSPPISGETGGEKGGEAPHKGEKAKGKGLEKRELIGIAFHLGFIIAVPVVIFGFFGKWLDARTGTSPMFTLIGIFTAIIFTSVWIYRKFRKYFKQ